MLIIILLFNPTWAKLNFLNLNQEISLYPTEGEFYEYKLDGSLICKINPQVPFIKVVNVFEEIYHTQGNQFRSISSNNTHFVGLSNENEIIMYEWKNQIMNQIGESVTINSIFKCFNINLSQRFSILIDCYQNNEFILIQLKDTQSTIAYSMQSSIPTSTKMYSIINGTNHFIVYGQFFENYSMLSLISSSFINQSNINNQFVDFDIPITISPNIYAITSSELLQISISSDSQFYKKSNFTSSFYLFNFTFVNAYYNLRSYNQCDQIILSSEYQIAFLRGCESLIILKHREYFQETVKVFQNNLFILYQQQNKISVQEKWTFQHLANNRNHLPNSLLYFNSDNELFSFNSHIIVQTIQFSSLQVNLTNFNVTGSNYTFSFICQKQFYLQTIDDQKFFISSQNYLQVLSQNDTNVYVMFNQDFPQDQTLLGNSLTQNFSSFSGQLLQYKLNPDGIPLNFIQMTSKKFVDIQKSYQLVQLLQQYEEYVIYLIGYSNYSIDVLLCISEYLQIYPNCILSNSIQISVNASSLQVAQSINTQMIIIGLNSNYTIYLFQYLLSNHKIISFSNQTFEKQFLDFVVTSNSIIILISNQEIEIMTLNFTNTFSLNETSINRLFNNIHFNPIQIVVNAELVAAVLYINNINEVIIILIDQYSFPIPVSLIHVNFAIKQVNLIYDQLILSYECNNDQDICFQVWNVQNLQKYYYVKNLYSLNSDNIVNIQSDNLFLYITFSNYTVYVYNPQLPYHMSLYYKLEFQSPIQCSMALINSYSISHFIKSIMILHSNNSIQELQSQQEFELSQTDQNQTLNYSKFYPTFIYNYNVTSALNENTYQQTPNQSITLNSNFTVFQYYQHYSVNLSSDNIIPELKSFSYPMNLILDRQVQFCILETNNQTNNLNRYCVITDNSGTNEMSIKNFNNFTLITSINNQFFALQNNFFIQTFNNTLKFVMVVNYSNLNQIICLKSTSSNYTLYSICQNSTSQYLLNFTFDQDNKVELSNTIQLFQQFQSISKMSTILNQIFILGSFNNEQQSLYWFNQSSNMFQSLSYFPCTDFSLSQMQLIKGNQLNSVIIFYIFNQQPSYKIMSIKNEKIKFYNEVFVQIDICQKQQTCQAMFMNYTSVLIISSTNKFLLFIVSDTQYSYISSTKINLEEILKIHNQKKIQQKAILIRTIPNYGNLINTGNSFYQNGILAQQFQYSNQNQYIVGIYSLNNLLNENLIEPILMQGSFITSISDYAIIFDQQQNQGTILYISGSEIWSCAIGTSNLTCLANSREDYMNIFINCRNQFSSGFYNIQFNLPPKFHFDFGPSAYILFLITLILLLCFVLKVKYKTRNFRYINSEVEL
ncbi:unnamed protein product [Paramecium octaurelia]|uniref:Transmembrane protein n=1 Tax=Paramecium octaurelia TaxID=43137 RepID=A0A8S1YHK9_PAROT|nr:unnamed protein product [Paramecium octaurelia]